MNQSYQKSQPRPPHPNKEAGRPQRIIQYPALDDKDMLGEAANILANDVVTACNNGKEGAELTKTQVRRFYTEIKNIERCIEDGSQTLNDDLYGRIKLIKAKATYSTARKSNKLPTAFADFIGHYIDQIRITEGADVAYKKFKAFCRLFEAFVGYSYAHPLLKKD